MAKTLNQIFNENKNYHSVFVKNDDGKWSHHFDADSHEDARDEMNSLKNQGVKTKKLIVPKHEAKWNKKDVHAYVSSRLKEEYEANTKDEKRFIDKHKVKKTEDKNGNDDKLFKASNIKKAKFDRMGYQPGEDKKVYESFKVGDKIHLGFGAKGGTGFHGTIHKIEGDMVHITSSKNKTYKGPKKFATKIDEAVGVSNDDRKHALYISKLTKGSDASKNRAEYYKNQSDDEKGVQARTAKNIARTVNKGKSPTKAQKNVIKGSAERKSYYDNQHSLYKNANKVVNKEEVETISEDYNAQNELYMKKAAKHAMSIYNYINKLATAKTSYGSPYYYDAKYLSRQLEDLCDTLENQVESYKKSKTLTKAAY